MQYLEQWLDQEQRTYNSNQLATRLEQERQVSLSADRKRLLLQKRGSIGNAPAAVSEDNKTLHTKNSNRQISANARVSSSRRLRGTQVFDRVSAVGLQPDR